MDHQPLATNTVGDTTGIAEAALAAVADFLARRRALITAARRALAESLAGGLRGQAAGRIECGGDVEAFLEQLLVAQDRRG